jgi:hypothetical protein
MHIMKVMNTLAAALILSSGATQFVQAQTAPVSPPAEVTSTAPTPQQSAPSPEPVPAPVATPAPAPTEPTVAPTPEQPAKIIFFRPGRLTGAVYTYHVVKVEQDGDSTRESPRVCSLPNGRFCVYEAVPGIYNFNIRGPMAVNLDEDRIRLEVEPGQTYYIEQTVRMGLITGGFRLVPSTQQEFERRKPREATLEAK